MRTAYVDISTTVDRKLDALRCHASQIKDFTEVEQWIREWSAQQGKEIGVANADGFFHVVIDEDETPEPAEAAEGADSAAAGGDSAADGGEAPAPGRPAAEVGSEDGAKVEA